MDWGMIGHGWAVSLLREHAALGRERHAYLFTGPSGVGRRTLALRFAQSLNCTKPPSAGEACHTCSSCKRIEQMQHPDLSVVQAEHEGEIIKIEQIRELQHTLSLAPYEARYRVALILRFEEAHNSSANAMLKTLEEPPEHVVVILTAKSAEDLLPTIVSRCEVLRLRTLPMDEIAGGLQTLQGVPEDVSVKLAHISDGRPGYAIRLYNNPKLIEQRQTWLEELLKLLAESQRGRFAFVSEIFDDKKRLPNEIRNEVRNKLQVWLTFWRDVFIVSGGMSDSITNLDYSGQIQKVADRIDLKQAKWQVSAIERTIEYIDRNVNTRLTLEVLLMDFPRTNISQ